MSREFFDQKFVPRFSPLALLGLLYTIVVMFAYQGHHIVQNLGPVFRVFVPMIMYFVVMWTSAFALVFYLARREYRKGVTDRDFAYEMAVVQAFTAGSNNFVRIFTSFKSLYTNAMEFVGACDRSRDRRVWSRIRSGVGSDYWAASRSSCASCTDLGGAILAR